MHYENSSRDVSIADTRTPTQLTHRWWTYRPTVQTTWWTCVPIHSYRSPLHRTHRREFFLYLEEMRLPLQISNMNSRTHRSCTFIGHRIFSSCYLSICCTRVYRSTIISHPGAKHVGEIWERLAPSCKKLLIAMLDNRCLTVEVVSTTMCLVELTLNARHMTAVSDDPEDLTALITNHFLLGPENASALFQAPKWPEKNNHNGSSICQQDLEKMNWEPKIEVTNGTKDRSGQKNMGENWKKEK